MIVNLTREFKVTKVPKVIIDPNEDKAKQFNKFWNYMYKSVDLTDVEALREEVELAIRYFFGGVTHRFMGDAAHKFLNVGSKDLGVLTALDYYGKIYGSKVNSCLKALSLRKELFDDNGVGIYVIDKQTQDFMVRYEDTMLLVDYSSLKGDGVLGFKKTRTTLFNEASSLVLDKKKGYVVVLVDARALWLAYKFAGLLEECSKVVQIGERDTHGRVEFAIYKVKEHLLEFPSLIRVFLGVGVSRMKDFAACLIGCHEAYKNMLKLLHSMYTDQIMLGYQEEYNRELSKTQAAVFQTKKHITKEKLALMESSKLLDRYSFVEIDNDIDNDTYRFIEEAIDKFPWVLPDNMVELRFRKLGNYKAAGLWFPYINNLCVDIRDVSSFVHEYGHAIDYLLSDSTTPLSLQNGFVDIRTRVFNEYQELKLEKMHYYGAPTEIFARSFEAYVYNKAYLTNLLKLRSEADFVGEYAPFANEQFFGEVIEPYFDKLLGVGAIEQIYPGELAYCGVMVCGNRAVVFNREWLCYEVRDVKDLVFEQGTPVVKVTEHLFSKLLQVIENKKLSDEEKVIYIGEGYEGLF